MWVSWPPCVINLTLLRKHAYFCLQRRILKPKEVEWLAQGHTVSPRLPDSKSGNTPWQIHHHSVNNMMAFPKLGGQCRGTRWHAGELQRIQVRGWIGSKSSHLPQGLPGPPWTLCKKASLLYSGLAFPTSSDTGAQPWLILMLRIFWTPSSWKWAVGKSSPRAL